MPGESSSVVFNLISRLSSALCLIVNIFSTRSRSPSPGLFGSTAASRAKQREAIISRSRSASAAGQGTPSL